MRVRRRVVCLCLLAPVLVLVLGLELEQLLAWILLRAGRRPVVVEVQHRPLLYRHPWVCHRSGWEHSERVSRQTPGSHLR